MEDGNQKGFLETFRNILLNAKKEKACLSEKEILTFFGILLLCSLILACILGPWGLIGFTWILYRFALIVGIGLAVSIPCLLTWNLMVSRFGYEKACVIASIILILIATAIMTITISILI